jgi:hypothetical protein
MIFTALAWVLSVWLKVSCVSVYSSSYINHSLEIQCCQGAEIPAEKNTKGAEKNCVWPGKSMAEFYEDFPKKRSKSSDLLVFDFALKSFRFSAEN